MPLYLKSMTWLGRFLFKRKRKRKREREREREREKERDVLRVSSRRHFWISLFNSTAFQITNLGSKATDNTSCHFTNFLRSVVLSTVNFVERLQNAAKEFTSGRMDLVSLIPCEKHVKQLRKNGL